MSLPQLLTGARVGAAAQNASINLYASSAKPNYDIREAHTKTDHAALDSFHQKVSRDQEQRAIVDLYRSIDDARTRLVRRVPSLSIQYSDILHVPEIVEAKSGINRLLTLASGEANETVLRRFLADNAALYGLTTTQAAQLRTTQDYTNPAGNLSWVTLEQQINGLPVFRGELRAAFTKSHELVRTASELAPGIDYQAAATAPSVSAQTAIAIGARSIGVEVDPNSLRLKSSSADGRKLSFEAGPFDEDTNVELIYFPVKPGVVVLAWAMTLWQDVPAYYTIVDAETGRLLWRKNITNEQTQSATYSIYNDDSPAPLSPTNALPGSAIQGAAISRTSLTLVSELPAFDNLGWITDGGNTTTGNNVDAGLDIATPNGIDPTGRPTGSPNRVFDFPYNPAPGIPAPGDAPTGANYRMGAVTNLFFWSNRYHDLLYQFGYTEASRNFQTDNFGRGGSGNDSVRAEVQDFGSLNNANFSTPADGSRPRMQMYIFNRSTPDRDGDLDADVFIHELTHGTSNRLHGNAAGLTGLQGVGMGEGWSDFYARALLSTADEDVNGVYAAGAYVTRDIVAGFTDNYYYGIRRFPYAVKTNVGPNGKPHYPLTYADIDPAQIDITDGAFPRGPVGADEADEVHNIGEIWCMMLLEVRARIITNLGFATGNQRALQIVTDGMKLDPSNPSLIDARNAILAADCAGFSGADELAIWEGFATRGLGFSAKNLGGVVEAFDMPNLTVGNVTFSDTACNNDGFADPGEQLMLNLPLTNPFCSTASTSATAMVVGGGSANYGTISGGGAVPQQIPFTVPAGTPCGSFLTVTVNINSSLGPVTRTFTLEIGQRVVGLTENFDGATPPLMPAGWTAQPVLGSVCADGLTAIWKTVTTTSDTAPNSAFAPEPTCTNDIRLDTPSIPITTPTARVFFRNFFNLETTFDGGVLEIAVDGGAFQDILAAGGSFVTGGYTGVFDASTQLAGRQAWTGNSTGFLTTIVNLPASANGHNIVLRFRVSTDEGTGGGGQFIDTFSVVNSYLCAAAAPNFSPTSQSFTATGGTGMLPVTAASCSTWSATSNNPEFITVDSGGGTGSGTVAFTIAQNTNTTARAGTITVGTQTFTVLQGAAFLDVPVGHIFYNQIGKLSARGITVGCGGGNYCPDAVVTREQMAAFIIRAMGEFNPPVPGSQRFGDVPPSNPFYNFIEQMAVRGITVGCGGGNYCPGSSVLREQMAAFIIRGIGEFNPPLPAMQRFGDVPPSNPFYNFIDRMAVLGITSGCSAMPALYCPTAPVTRGQMAVFLVVAFNL
jgi:extracellular elastinolytic metalloproteinase